MSAPDASPSQAPEVSRESVVNDFRKHMQGKLDDAKLDAAAQAMTAAMTAYPASAYAISLVFYMRVEVQLNGAAQKFSGNAGGVGQPGAGGFFGNVYTDDLAKLYAQTRVFEYHGTYVYTGVTFWDDDSNLLGHFEGGGLGIMVGVGGGTGSWA
jgi:Rhodococcus equi virulence-associated protein